MRLKIVVLLFLCSYTKSCVRAKHRHLVPRWSIRVLIYSLTSTVKDIAWGGAEDQHDEFG